ncbi:GGDEF domain-containing protein [Pseudoduganella aquatica]|uniref:diguanylate cyclase n=1 Tax=Pseudoduganella aquatica TaxID=2660641 RepID=A0A7X4HCF5_9BURK|nr:GGDEF domain-containing protein [Pseudoduganella aquatica]MYN08701.1 diguanylate cyclase [Pseudoduganella aquatica]
MDPKTVYLIAALMMLANGGVLGLMHGDLPHSLRPSAVSWRVSTLVHACGCLLFLVQDLAPRAVMLPLGNALFVLGFTGYWRALRQFYGAPDSPWIWLPAIAGGGGVFWYNLVQPDMAARVAVLTLTWLFILGACVWHLHSQKRRARASSRRVMTGLFVGVMVFMLLRLAYFLIAGVPPGYRVSDGAYWINVASPLVVAAIPVIGTTAFLLMCSERIRRQWERAASTDYLTGLANRRTLADTGERRFAAGGGFSEARPGMGVALVDIDHFKQVNDRYGHAIGDVALKQVAERLEAACRETELPARQGGEEFVVLFEAVDAAGARAAGERLRQAVAAQPFMAGELKLAITVSIGVAVRAPGDAGFDDLLRRADAALYAAKAAGRNRVECAALEIEGGIPNYREPVQHPTP